MCAVFSTLQKSRKQVNAAQVNRFLHSAAQCLHCILYPIQVFVDDIINNIMQVVYDYFHIAAFHSL